MRPGIDHGEQITVRIVSKSGGAVNGIGELGDAVQGIWRVEGLLPERIGDVPELSRCVEDPLRFPIQRVFHLDQIAQFIGKRRDVIERIGDRGGLVQGVGDGREIALRIVAERGRVTQRIGDRERLRQVLQ